MRAYGQDDRRDKGPDELPVWAGPAAQHGGHVVGEAAIAVEPGDGDQLARRDENDAVRHAEVVEQLHHVDAALRARAYRTAASLFVFSVLRRSLLVRSVRGRLTLTLAGM